jgi:hypothetical protein
VAETYPEAAPTPPGTASRGFRPSFRVPSGQAEASQSEAIISSCAFCGTSRAGTVKEAADWFRLHRAQCAEAPKLLETETMRARARHSLARREREAKIQAHRDRKRMLRLRATELVERGNDPAAIATMWNRDAIQSFAPGRIPWSASSVANLIRPER